VNDGEKGWNLFFRDYCDGVLLHWLFVLLVKGLLIHLDFKLKGGFLGSMFCFLINYNLFWRKCYVENN